ncbi:HU family DNA-binding protein [Marinibactrum halimedae]|uniref:Integration host factor n=1 Tax=Marinibactrum halimedae TaxID=1444977 RepID=A0AA37T9P0_9GAMM|nr:HU family DNA-binding protein [Marinibactrum halimedae]MCD9459956.1 HU family DNA-binding protein [Marinibactrum halimedae]GLS28276.1 integration host factor [Marinibactrum halimedae]
MHKTELVAAVADIADLPKEKASTVVSAILDEITNALSRDEVVSLVGFGTFSQRHRAARTGRSPKTGETIQIAASTTVGFKPGKALKDSVNP